LLGYGFFLAGSIFTSGNWLTNSLTGSATFPSLLKRVFAQLQGSSSGFLIQSTHGQRGNFELTVTNPLGGFAHYWRNNDRRGTPWIVPFQYFGSSYTENATLIQSNYGSGTGNLEVIARIGNRLAHYWREDSGLFTWHGPTFFFDGAEGVPGFIQSRFGDRGNFEVVTPIRSGGMRHLWRNNDNPNQPWNRLPNSDFGVSLGHIDAVALIQSNYTTSTNPLYPGLGNFEVAAKVGNCTYHSWRRDRSPYSWSNPQRIGCENISCYPATQGEWRIPYSSSIVGIHVALLHTGKVVSFTYAEGTDHLRGNSVVLDPITGNEVRLPLDKNVFCAGQSFLPDGRLVVAGGHIKSISHLRALHIFSPLGNGGSWNEHPIPLSGPRWYPTLTTLPDGRIFIISGLTNGPGSAVNSSYEIFDPNSGLQPRVDAPILREAEPYSSYPFIFVLPNGKLFIHANNRTGFLDLQNLSTGNFDNIVLFANHPAPRNYNLEGSCVLLPLTPTTNPPYNPRIMLIGGGSRMNADENTPATDTCEILDFSINPLAWRYARSMPHPRVLPDAVLLPDGTVLIVNGSRTGKADLAKEPVLPADLYNPTTNEWTTLCSMRVPRLYHSTALLLPDGRVMTAGTDKDFNHPLFQYSEYRIEIFSPPYLFKGERPIILDSPSLISYGSSFTITKVGDISSGAIIRQGAVTHSFNMDQRYIELNIINQTSDTLTLQAPPNRNIATPGYYMLFILNGSKIPSIAKFVQLTAVS
jgi:hypothetical protein